MSSKIFEEKIEEAENDSVIEQPIEIEEPVKKKGKHKKPMTAERKAELCERLKKARLVSQQKRGAKAKEKKLKKLKEVEADLENSMVEKITKKAKEKLVQKKEDNSEDLEKKIEERLRKKLENEYSHKYKDDTINSLKEQLKELKENKKLKIIEEKKEEIKKKEEVKSNKPLSLMDKYRLIQQGKRI